MAVRCRRTTPNRPTSAPGRRAASCRTATIALYLSRDFRRRSAGGIWEEMKVSEVIRILRDDGWYLDRVRGSHRQYKHLTKPGVVTIAGKPSDDLAPGTLKSIFKQAGLGGST